MTRRVRFILFGCAAVAVAVLLGFGIAGMRPFGGDVHPYRDHAVHAAVQHVTANVVSSVNFDQRALDTLGEEMILLASVVGASVLLRPTSEERERAGGGGAGRTLAATQVMGYLVLAVTLVVGIDVVVHGHVTPGGGFQGGVVLATAVHLLYVAGRYAALRRLRPEGLHEVLEAVGSLSFVSVGLAALVASGAFLANVVSFGSFGQLLSAGTVPVLNVAVGLAVGSGCIVLLADFLQQAIDIAGGQGQGDRSSGQHDREDQQGES
ncbi:MAG TPA: MnhB domain-containing protein [Segeticoccus sp.]|uniref:MnhB domain-containing protein n=1 Tax=Segeticoccus sp. TaxID=2706531 RepID=UPI002D7E45D4|nr:MnhB domain-containing protein [Segeticoccus sp.]HET8598962.1 MnhB domain-containing protein [Segeticoccus sp.]